MVTQMWSEAALLDATAHSLHGLWMDSPTHLTTHPRLNAGMGSRLYFRISWRVAAKCRHAYICGVVHLESTLELW
jgi:hypothetical protein